MARCEVCDEYGVVTQMCGNAYQAALCDNCRVGFVRFLLRQGLWYRFDAAVARRFAEEAHLVGGWGSVEETMEAVAEVHRLMPEMGDLCAGWIAAQKIAADTQKSKGAET